jgi:hypothetical protein
MKTVNVIGPRDPQVTPLSIRPDRVKLTLQRFFPGGQSARKPYPLLNENGWGDALPVTHQTDILFSKPRGTCGAVLG